MTQHYAGTKIVKAWPQDKPPGVHVCGVTCRQGGEQCNGYCEGRADSPNTTPAQPGYGVMYEDGYSSWSPKDVFEAAYKPLGHLDAMLPHEQRMMAEFTLLHGNHERLSAFIGTDKYKALDNLDQCLLADQRVAMAMYLDCLGMRIERAVGYNPMHKDGPDGE